ncbi:hypothetical protein [Bacteroides clarus]|uniref:hypothetical protein n=1 Tax=Bacteroides clarus TaxID=626929 RepID=UPI001E2D47B1|nr:hypothetical protein [Bacteroides clarus]
MQAGTIPIGNLYAWWFIDFITLYTLWQFKKVTTRYYLIDIFLGWVLISTIRGIFIAENYWEWKQLISGFLALSIPLFSYAFDKPHITGRVIRYWLKYAILLFLLQLPTLPNGAYHFYLGPVFLVGCFIPITPRKWQYILIGLLIIMLSSNLDARSQVIKSAIVLLIAIGIYFWKIIPNIVFKVIHWACYIIPIVLLILGVTGRFNIFENLESNKGKYVEKVIMNGQVVEIDLSTDTRTFIYTEVIESAIKHDYVIWGRTPARGNDSRAFGAYNAEILKTGKYERHKNELCHLNIFTWLGLIGVILYTIIYLRSSYLAIYKSENIYLRFLGCFIAFRWAYGWIEDINSFNIMNISLWMMIAIGLSSKFRSMNNKTFKDWFLKCFPF